MGLSRDSAIPRIRYVNRGASHANRRRRRKRLALQAIVPRRTTGTPARSQNSLECLLTDSNHYHGVERAPVAGAACVKGLSIYLNSPAPDDAPVNATRGAGGLRPTLTAAVGAQLQICRLREECGTRLTTRNGTGTETHPVLSTRGRSLRVIPERYTA